MSAHEVELAELRRRVFGPDADLAGDPEAVGRLAALEAARRGEAEPVVEDEAAGQPAAADDVPAPGAVPAEPAETSSAPVVDPQPDAPRRAPTRFALARSTQLLWAGTLGVTVCITALVSAGLGRTVYVDVEGGAEVVATLAPDDSAEPMIEGMRGYEEFEGLQPILSGRQGHDCLWIVERSGVSVDGDSWSISGMSVEGCGTGPFPAAAVFAVDENASDALRAAYPAGTAFRMVHIAEDDRVVVFKSAAPSSGQTAEGSR